MKTTWETPADLNTWSLADLIAVRDFMRRVCRFEEAAAITTELRRRKFTA